MENKRKHLEFLQNVITRMNTNSFLLKGWSITLVSALFALAAKEANIKFVLISYISIPVFWMLDGFFISREKQYRALFKSVSEKSEEEIDFNMEPPKIEDFRMTWLAGIFSKTLVPFYGISILIILIVMLLMK